MNHCDEELRKAVALFRYGLIADVLRLPPGSREIRRTLHEKAQRTYTIPGTRRTRVAVETMRDWLSLYRNGGCCLSLSLVGTPRYLTGLFRRRIAWDDGTIREGCGAGEVAFSMNRCCGSGEAVGARAASVGKGWASAAHLSMPCPHAP